MQVKNRNQEQQKYKELRAQEKANEEKLLAEKNQIMK